MTELDLLDLTEPRDVLDAAIAYTEPVEVWALFSGGHDSLTATATTFDLVDSLPVLALHVDTGIGVPDTAEFVHATARRHGWPLHVARNETPRETYDTLVLEHGFPGPAGHGYVYRRLKHRAIEAFTRQRKAELGDPSARFLLVAGCRSQESTRRMGTTRPIARERADRRVRVWANPIHAYTKIGVNDALDRHGLDRSPVVDLLHKSGECLCGAYAKRGELDELAIFYPAVAARIRALEARAAAAGVPCRWGERPPAKTYAGQLALDVGPACHSCEGASG